MLRFLRDLPKMLRIAWFTMTEKIFLFLAGYQRYMFVALLVSRYARKPWSMFWIRLRCIKLAWGYARLQSRDE